MIYDHTAFQVPSSSGSLVIAINERAKHRFREASVKFYVLQMLP